MKPSVYDMVTNQIISHLKQGIVPWHKPWLPAGGRYRNFITGKPYRGVNVYLLNVGFSSPYWLTFKQVQQIGGQVRKGEFGTKIVFWKFIKTVDETEAIDGDEKKIKNIPILKYYTVFNIEQCLILEDKLPKEEKKQEMNPIYEAQKIIDNMPNRPVINHGGDRACYSPFFDKISMPKFEQFDNSEFYYSVIFHELAHSTGHYSRLDRKEVVNCTFFGSPDYSKEELVAEMTAAFLSATVGIEQRTLENSAAYIQSWLRRLKEDKKLIVFAAAAAQKAADYILNCNEENGCEDY